LGFNLIKREQSKAMGKKIRRKHKEQIDYSLINQKNADWCINNGYRVYVIGVDSVPYNKKNKLFTTFNIVIQRGVEYKTSSGIYTKIGASNKIWEIYGWLYDKHADR